LANVLLQIDERKLLEVEHDDHQNQTKDITRPHDSLILLPEPGLGIGRLIREFAKNNNDLFDSTSQNNDMRFLATIVVVQGSDC
jgi:hypothetical protein